MVLDGVECYNMFFASANNNAAVSSDIKINLISLSNRDWIGYETVPIISDKAELVEETETTKIWYLVDHQAYVFQPKHIEF